MKKFVMIDSHTIKIKKFKLEKEYLESKGFEVLIATCNTIQDVIDVASDADCIGVNKFEMDKQIISELKSCKGIVRYGIGYDNIDVTVATEAGILVCNLPDFCGEEVATHAMALILDLCRKTTIYDRYVRTGKWDSNYGYKIHRLSELNLGLIGFGNVARRLSQFAKPFGLNIVAYDPFIDENIFQEYYVNKVSIDQLYRESDIISLHVPLTRDTRHMISKPTIEKMKDKVMIVNTSRGGLINTDDLIGALESGKIKAAGLDVLEEEPLIDSDSILYKYENVVVTPHAAYNSVEATNNRHLGVAYTAEKILNGQIPENAINKNNIKNFKL